MCSTLKHPQNFRGRRNSGARGDGGGGDAYGRGGLLAGLSPRAGDMEEAKKNKQEQYRLDLQRQVAQKKMDDERKKAEKLMVGTGLCARVCTVCVSVGRLDWRHFILEAVFQPTL